MRKFLFLFLFLLIIPLLIIPLPQVFGDNTISQIIKINGTIVGGVEDETFILPTSLSNLDKTIVFMSLRHIGEANTKEVYRSWELINNTAITFFGSNNVPANNDALDFVGYLVEFTASSDVLVQNGTFSIAGGLSDQEFTDVLSPSVNVTESFYIFSGQDLDHADLTWGQEELARMRINSTHFLYEPFDAPNSGLTNIRYQVIDFNNSNFLVQRGIATLNNTNATTTVTPPTAINRNNTIVFSSYNTDGLLNEEPHQYAISTTINPSNILEFKRETGACDVGDEGNCIINIRWETISFPNSFATVQHLEFDDITSTGANVQQTGTVTIPTSVNVANSIAIGTGHIPFGLGQARTDGTAKGGFDQSAYTVELISSTQVEVVINDGQALSDISFQVIEFTGGVVFNQNIIDTVTVAPDDPDFTITKEAVDVGAIVDLETNMIITKLRSDIASAGDTVNANAIFVIELNDQGETIDVLSINITKLNQEVISGLDELDFDIAKGLVDTATVIDQVDPQLIALLLLTDLASTNDEVRLAITKLLEDDIVTSDEINFVVNKLLQDTAIISDLSETAVTFGVSELDTVTTNDLVILDITKQLTDVASGLDNVNIEGTKIFLDTTSIVDTTEVILASDRNVTDVITIIDTTIFNATKAFEDISTISDDVILLRTKDLLVSDTISVNDPSILFKITTTVQGTGGGGGGAPTPQFERIIGLFVESELIHLQKTDRINSDFKIHWFGQDRSPTTITRITTEPEFSSWIQFSPTPDLLDVDQSIDGSRTINDPARFVNLALDDFVVIAPSISCDQVDIFDSPAPPCLDPILYQIPVEFEFTKSGVKFHADHIIQIDARVGVSDCNFFGFEMPQGTCEVAQFGIDNWIWFIIIFGMLYFSYLIIPRLSGKTRNVRRAGSRDLESMSDRKVKRKFKRGKRR